MTMSIYARHSRRWAEEIQSRKLRRKSDQSLLLIARTNVRTDADLKMTMKKRSHLRHRIDTVLQSVVLRNIESENLHRSNVSDYKDSPMTHGNVYRRKESRIVKAIKWREMQSRL